MNELPAEFQRFILFFSVISCPFFWEGLTFCNAPSNSNQYAAFKKDSFIHWLSFFNSFSEFSRRYESITPNTCQDVMENLMKRRMIYGKSYGYFVLNCVESQKMFQQRKFGFIGAGDRKKYMHFVLWSNLKPYERRLDLYLNKHLCNLIR